MAQRHAMGQTGHAGTFPRQAPVGRPPVTKVDRWWLAYCALGAALIIRAPSWGWALLVLGLWALIQPLGDLAAALWIQRSEASAVDAEHAELRTKYTERARADKTVVIPRAAPATATEVTDRLRVGGFDPVAMPKVPPGPAMGAEVTRLVISGQVWTTHELLSEIRKVIDRDRPPGGRRD